MPRYEGEGVDRGSATVPWSMETTHARIKAVQAFIKSRRDYAAEAIKQAQVSMSEEQARTLREEASIADAAASAAESTLSILF